ncbi:unnamed protein product, partial [Allacma fusca]
MGKGFMPEKIADPPPPYFSVVTEHPVTSSSENDPNSSRHTPENSTGHPGPNDQVTLRQNP